MLSSYGAGLVYSERDPSTGNFQLFHYDGARPPAALPVPERAVPFDADLGPGTDHSAVAVYSRCATEPPLPAAGMPDYTKGRGCHVYEVDVASGAERRLAISGVLPTVWKDTVASVAPVSKAIRVGTRRVAGGPKGGSPTSLDLRGGRLAFGWSYGDDASQIRIDDARSGRLLRRVDTYGGGGLTTLVMAAPAFDGASLYWARLCDGDPSGCPHRDGLMRLSGAHVARAAIGRDDLWQARAGDVTYVLRDGNGEHACHSLEPSVAAPPCTILALSPSYR
jgi:hypothetical protein